MAYRLKYRTKDRSTDYFFSFEQKGREWRAYIEWQPSYGRRATGNASTHRLPDGNRKYVCWTHPLKSLEEAKKVAALWADNTQEYIRTGRKF
jgi:hypothetical protein